MKTSNTHYMDTFGNKFGNFLDSAGAIAKLIQRAQDNDSFIEAIVLYVAGIDQMLRCCLLNSAQLKAKRLNVGLELISQEENGSRYTEKQIYEMALCTKLVSKNQYYRLLTLYEYRNQIVHRFSLTSVTYARFSKVLNRYHKLYMECLIIMSGSEKRLIKNGLMSTMRFSEKAKKHLEQQTMKKLGEKMHR